MAKKLTFSTLVSLFDPNPQIFAQKMDTFLTRHHGHAFSALRLIAPEIDRKRCCYGSKSSIISVALKSLGIPSEERGETEEKLRRKIEIEVTRRENRSSGLTIEEVNKYLDRLALPHDRDKVFVTLVNKTSAQEMLFVLSIILRRSRRLPSSFLTRHINPLQHDARCFSLDMAQLVCILRRREPGITFAGRFRIETFQPATATSLCLRLHLDKTPFKALNKSDVATIYAIYDKPKDSLDLWYTTKKKIISQEDSVHWTTCNSQRMHPLQSQSFLDDEGALVSLVVARGLEPYLFLGPPDVIEIHSYFFPHQVESTSSFPHLFSITTSRLFSGWKATFQLLQQKATPKMSKGCLFVCTKTPETLPLDRDTRLYKDMLLPSFVLDKIGRDNLDSVSTDFFLFLTAELTRSSSAMKQEKLVQSLSFMRSYQLLDLLVHCTYWIQDLHIEEFVEGLCLSLAKRLVASGNTAYATEMLVLDR